MWYSLSNMVKTKETYIFHSHWVTFLPFWLIYWGRYLWPRPRDFVLPAPGAMVQFKPCILIPPVLKGIKIHPENPFRFDFILGQGR